MRDTEITLTFAHEFHYPVNGGLGVTKTLTVCEPGFTDRDIYRRMSGFVGEAQKEMLIARERSQVDKAARERDAADEAAREEQALADAKAKAATDSDKIEGDAEQMMAIGEVIMQLGMDADRQAEFKRYVERVLTGNPRLAFIADDMVPGGRIALSEGLWMSLAQANGVAAIDMLVLAFLGFFLKARTTASATWSGTTPSLPSASPAPVSSARTRRH